MSAKPILYYHILSPPARGVLLAAAAVGVELELREVNLLEKENLKPEFLKVNPQHTIPFLDDNGAIIVDSHVIAGYLVDKYGRDDKLYPKDIVKRAQVDSRLFFNACNLFARSRMLFEPILFEQSPKLDEWRMNYIAKNWETLDRFVSETPYVCGNELTIADLCLIASISSACNIIKIDPATYPNLTKWIERMKQLPYYQEKNGNGADLIQQIILDTVEKNAKSKTDAIS